MRISDWSSDVCSSDLAGTGVREDAGRRRHRAVQVLAVHRPGMAGRALRRAPGRPPQALEAVADRPQGAQRLRRLHPRARGDAQRSEEHTSELQSLMRISYAVFCLNKKHKYHNNTSQPMSLTNNTH